MAQRAVDVAKTAHSGDAVADEFLVASNTRLTGDIQRALGNEGAARASWGAAQRLMPAAATEPNQMAERAMIFRRLGRDLEAQQIAGRLAKIGYRDPAG